MSFIGDSFGQLKETGLDLLLKRPGTVGVMPSQVVLSSQCFISFKIDNKQNKEYIAEFDQFSKTKIITEKKNFKPYGYMHNISLINDQGWELSLNGKKTDPKLNTIIALQEYLLSGNNNSGFGDKYKASAAKLTFNIEEIITYKSGPMGDPILVEYYTYKDCSLVSYNEDTPSDNQPVTFSMKFFCPKRGYRNTTTGSDDTITPSKLGDSISNMINGILQSNRQ
jgi:hypothetical protein